MKNLKQLLERMEYTLVQGSVDREITELIYDSRKAAEGVLFVCVKGTAVDGHDFAGEVAGKGAAALVVQEDVKVPEDVTVIKVKDTREALAFLSAAWFDYPADSLKVIGVTGTKGKTTTTYMVKSILESAGYRVGLIGTIEAVIGDTHIPAANTTPESYLVQQYFRQMLDEGCALPDMDVAAYREAAFGYDIHNGWMHDEGGREALWKIIPV